MTTFSANQSGNATANISVPTALSQLTQTSSYRTVKDTDKNNWNNKQSALSTISSDELYTGTSTTARSVRADYLRSGIIRIASNYIDKSDDVVKCSTGAYYEDGETFTMHTQGPYIIIGRTNGGSIVFDVIHYGSTLSLGAKNMLSYTKNGSYFTITCNAEEIDIDIFRITELN